uniref:Circadian clock-controlled protein n=1 Tax=Graphocephala atropunctata TaxID=36148 RepID=A0A1B6KVN1_9HEMI
MDYSQSPPLQAAAVAEMASIVAVVLLSALGITLAAESTPGVVTSQPEWISKPCSWAASDVDQCLKEQFQGMFPYLMKGIPEIGIPQFEPLYIDKIGITKGRGTVKLQGNFNQLYAHGPSKSVILAARLDKAGERLQLSLYIPEIRTESNYELDGNILLLPIKGKGKARLIITNATADASVKMTFPRLPTGQEVMQASDMKIDFRMDDVKIELDNLFNGNRLLGRKANKFVNKNAMVIVNTLRDDIGDSLSEVFKKIINDGYGRTPTQFWLQRDTSA